MGFNSMEEEFPDTNYQPRQPGTCPIAATLFAPPGKIEQPPPLGFSTRVHLWALYFKSVDCINRNLVLNHIKKKNSKTNLISRAEAFWLRASTAELH
jgi:hypothetical protein